MIWRSDNIYKFLAYMLLYLKYTFSIALFLVCVFLWWLILDIFFSKWRKLVMVKFKGKMMPLLKGKMALLKNLKVKIKSLSQWSQYKSF